MTTTNLMVVYHGEPGHHYRIRKERLGGGVLEGFEVSEDHRDGLL